MLPSTISRRVPVPVVRNLWAENVVLKTTALPSWVAMHRTDIGCDASERVQIARMISRRLGLSESSRRNEYKVSDAELLRLAKIAVTEIRWHADAQWALQQWQARGFDPTRGEYVAIYSQAIQGYGDDPDELRESLALKYGVPPQRIIVDCLHDYVADRGQ